MAARKTKAGKEHQAVAEVKLVPIELVDVLPQIRKTFNQESIEELAADIQERGLLQPVLLNPVQDRFQLIAGERRLRAVQFNGTTHIPALLTKAGPEEAKLMQLAENIQREELTLEETCDAIMELKKHYKNLAEVAKHVKKSVAWVSKRFSLGIGNLNWRILELIEEGATEDIELIKALEKLEKEVKWDDFNAWCKKVKAKEAGRNEVRQALKEAKENNKREQEEEEQEEEVSQAKKPSPAPAEKWMVANFLRELNYAMLGYRGETGMSMISELKAEQLEEVTREILTWYKHGENASNRELIEAIRDTDKALPRMAMMYGILKEEFHLVEFLEKNQRVKVN